MNAKPKALDLADDLDYLVSVGSYAGTATHAAAELRRLHGENKRLKAQRKPLTDEEIKDAVRGAGLSFTSPDFKVARAIEAKLREKNA